MQNQLQGQCPEKRWAHKQQICPHRHPRRIDNPSATRVEGLRSGEAQFQLPADGIADLGRILNEALGGGKKSVRFASRGVQVRSEGYCRCKHWHAGDCHYTILERLAQGLEDTAAEFGEFIQEEHALGRPRHVPWGRHLAPADQPDIGDGVGGRASWARRDQGRPVAREAGDAMEARGLKGLSQGHGRQDGGESPRQHRPACPGRAEQGLLWSERLHHV
jgi:hypothetical protein